MSERMGSMFEKQDWMDEELKAELDEIEAAKREFEAQSGNTAEATPEAQEQVTQAETSVEKQTSTETTDDTVQLAQDSTQAAEHPVKPEDDPNSDTWKHKYEVLKGKEYAEVPRLSAENKTLRETLAQYQAEIDAIKAKIQPPAEPAKPAEPEIDPADAAELAEELGIEQAQAMKILAKQAKIAARQIERVKGEIEPVKETIQQMHKTQAELAREAFDRRLNAEVPNWEKINADEKFLRFLGPNGVNELRQNAQRGDIESVVERFKTFEQLFTQPPAAPPQTKASPQAQAQRQQIAAQAVPATTGTAASATTGPRKYTQAEWDKVWDEIENGVHDSEKSLRLMNELNAAYAEGRVTLSR